MNSYNPGDEATFYFIQLDYQDSHHQSNRMIKAWTDDKTLAKYYMEFHKCKNMSLKSMTGEIEKIIKVINENANDEIEIMWIKTRDPDKKGQTKMIPIPCTNTEFTMVMEEARSFMLTEIDYGYMSQVIPYLKPKWQRALKACLLDDIIRSVVHNRHSELIKALEVDQLIVLVNCFPKDFGE